MGTNTSEIIASNPDHSAAAQHGGPFGTGSDSLDRPLLYRGNRVSSSVANAKTLSFDEAMNEDQLVRLVSNPAYKHLHDIDAEIFVSAVDYFRKLGAKWANLPLTTRMISSPGEVYAGHTLDYTTDTLPVDIRWFDSPKNIFLAESSQFYLELRLLLEDVHQVYCVYNSFRKETADFSHLAEFQHIEYEGHVGFEENVRIAENLVRHLVESTAKNCGDALRHYLSEGDVDSLQESVSPSNFETITFKEALKVLFKATGDARYKQFTLKHFGSWEEVKLTELLGKHVWVTHFPMAQIPFYHNQFSVDEDGVPLAENADLIMYGYREVVGSGVRITSPELLARKAKVFNLPVEDYAPYLKTRDLDHYRPSAGFGLGWQRLTHWMLKLPAIWEASHIPRGHVLPTV